MVNKKRDFHKGQKIWYFIDYLNELKEGEITTVGRKYLTVNERYQFHIDTLKEKEYSGDAGVLYLRKEDYELEQELKSNIRTLRNVFSIHRINDLTLEQTRDILKVLKELKL